MLSSDGGSRFGTIGFLRLEAAFVSADLIEGLWTAFTGCAGLRTEGRFAVCVM